MTTAAKNRVCFLMDHDCILKIESLVHLFVFGFKALLRTNPGLLFLNLVVAPLSDHYFNNALSIEVQIIAIKTCRLHFRRLIS